MKGSYKIPPVVFLVGGTGNQLWQASCYGLDCRYSGFFLSMLGCRLTGFKKHENFLQLANISLLREWTALVLLGIDLCFFKIFGRTVITKLGVNFGLSKPIISTIIIVDYCVGQEGPHEIDFVKNRLVNTRSEKVVMHVRGGDLLSSPALIKYGHLHSNYYADALKRIMKISNSSVTDVVIITDDYDYATLLVADLGLPNTTNIEINSSSLEVAFDLAIHSEFFVSSNSTLSYWLVRLRGRETSLVPKPFWAKQDFDFDGVEFIRTKY